MAVMSPFRKRKTAQDSEEANEPKMSPKATAAEEKAEGGGKKNWAAGAFKNAHGQLHRALGVPAGKTIDVRKLEIAVKKGGINAKRAQAVLNIRRK